MENTGQTNDDGGPRWLYRVFSEIIYRTDLGQFRTYGIHLCGYGLQEAIHDISLCKDSVTAMTEAFNRLQLSPCHFRDTVEDLLF